MSKNDPIILPEKYYLDYFKYVLAFVEKQYTHILDEPEYLFYQTFRNLTEQAQCLYLRFSNRKGDFFRISKISYAEIPDVRQAKEELMHHGLIQINESNDPCQFGLFTKAELLSYFDFLPPGQKKSELLVELTANDIAVIHKQEEIAQILKNDEVAFIKLLFFGHSGGRMTDFVIRDVGHVKIQSLNESKFKPWFESREEALSVMHISHLRHMIYELQQAGLPLEEYLDEIPWKTWLSYPRSAKVAEKLLLKIAYHFEQVKQPHLALKYYSFTDKPPSRERKIRIMDKTGLKDKAVSIAQEMMTNPTNATELTFATDFLNRKNIRINRSMTDRLKSAPTITIPTPNMPVEKAVLAYYEKKGWQGEHTENHSWKGLFGLIFWDLIFDESHGSFHQPLQRQPSDLNDSAFFETRQDSLQELLNTFKSRKQFKKHICHLHDHKQGMANRFVSWHEDLLPTLIAMIEKIPLEGLKKVLLEMAKNIKENSTGFPDLFIWNATDYHFYEVKSPNDQLSAQQLFWLNFFDATKIKADVLRVSYQD